MRFDRILDEVFATWSHIAVLRTLMDATRPLSGREIARVSHMNHRSCLQALTRLELIGFVNRNRGGRDHLFVVNRDHRLWTEAVLPMLEIERRHLGRLAKRLRKEFTAYVESAILFGASIAKTESKEPIVDVCLIINNRMAEKDIQAHLSNVARIAWQRYGAKLQTVVFTESEFNRRTKRSHASVAAILKDGQVILGKSLRDLVGTEIPLH